MSFVSWFLQRTGLSPRRVPEAPLQPSVLQGQLSIARDFSRFPAGRVKADGPRSGQHLRELILRQEGDLTIDFDGTMGYGSSFLQGAFQGLYQDVPLGRLRLRLISKEDPSIADEVWQYINS